MKPITRPARGRAPSRSLRILAAIVAAWALAIPFGAVPAHAVSPPGWTTETPVAGTYHTRPAVAKDAVGHLGVAWQEADAAAGILFATDASGSWTTERISTGDDWTPDLVFDGSGAAHVVFARFGSDGGLYHATNATGAWVVTPLRTDVIPWSPSLAIDGAGKLHVAYASEGFTPGIWYLTNATGAWVATRVSTGTWDSEPSLALDGSSKVHVAFARYERPSPGLLLATNTTGTWVTTRLTTNADLDDYPALVIDGAGKRHIAAVRYFADPPASLLYLTDESGAWVTSQLGAPAGGPGPGIPAIGLDQSGEPEIVARAGYTTVADDTLWRYSGLPWGTQERLMTGTERSEEFPDILRDAAGRLVVAYRGAWHAPGIVVHREDPDEDSLIAPSVLVGLASLRNDGSGAKHLAFERYATDASDGTSYATDASGSWADETIAATHGKPSLGITYPGVRRVAIPDRLFSSTETGWDVHAFGVAGGTDVDLDDQPTSMSSLNWKLAYLIPGVGIRVMDAAFNEEPATAGGADDAPDIIAGGAGSEHYLLAFTRGGALYALRRYWQDPLLETPQLLDSTWSWDPAAVLGNVDSIYRSFIAYDRGGSAPGIYLADDWTYMGDWERTRLSRAYADVTPVIASHFVSGVPDQDASFYITWARACGGPGPGIYVATNRSGSWVTTQVVQSCSAVDPSITVLPDGRMSIAYLEDPDGIVVVTETSVAGGAWLPAASPATRSARATDRALDRSGSTKRPVLAPAATGPAAAHGSATVSPAQLAGRLPEVDR